MGYYAKRTCYLCGGTGKVKLCRVPGTSSVRVAIDYPFGEGEHFICVRCSGTGQEDYWIETNSKRRKKNE